MLIAPNQGEDLRRDFIPVLHDLPVRRPHHEVAEREKSAVSRSVGLEVMPPSPIELEDQSIADQQIDPDSPDRDLTPHVHAQSPQPESRQRLDPRLCSPVDQPEQATPAWGVGQQAFQRRRGDHAAVKGGVDHDDSGSQIETPDRFEECGFEAVDTRCQADAVVSPVQPNAGLPKHMGAARHAYV